MKIRIANEFFNQMMVYFLKNLNNEIVREPFKLTYGNNNNNNNNKFYSA